MDKRLYNVTTRGHTTTRRNIIIILFHVMTDSEAELSSSKHQNSRNNGADDGFDSCYVLCHHGYALKHSERTLEGN